MDYIIILSNNYYSYRIINDNIHNLNYLIVLVFFCSIYMLIGKLKNNINIMEDGLFNSSIIQEDTLK